MHKSGHRRPFGNSNALRLTQTSCLGLAQMPPLPRSQVRGQADRPVAQPREAADLKTDRLPEAAHLSITALVQYHAKPGVSARFGPGVTRGCRLDAIKSRRTVLERHAKPQPLERRGVRPAAHPHEVLALELRGGVHQMVR